MSCSRTSVKFRIDFHLEGIFECFSFLLYTCPHSIRYFLLHWRGNWFVKMLSTKGNPFYWIIKRRRYDEVWHADICETFCPMWWILRIYWSVVDRTFPFGILKLWLLGIRICLQNFTYELDCSTGISLNAICYWGYTKQWSRHNFFQWKQGVIF